jgi:hypothetical protein
LIGGVADRSSTMFNDFVLPTDPVQVVTVGLQIVTIDDGSREFAELGLLPGHICRYCDTDRFLITGVLFDDRSIAAVIRETQRFFDLVPLTELNSKYPLVGRRGHKLIQSGEVWIDRDSFFYGLRAGDTLSDGAQLLGTCGRVFYAQLGESIRPVNLDNCCLARSGRRLVKIETVDDDCYAEEADGLVLHSYFGAGMAIGQSDDGFYVRFLADGRRSRRVSGKSMIFMSRDRVDVCADSGEHIVVDGTDRRTLDLVTCSRGFGVVAGSLRGGALAVWIEGNCGKVSVLKKTEVKSIARLNGELFVEGGLNANCADFARCPVLPGDELENGVVVGGLKGETVYGWARDGTIVAVDCAVGIRTRHMFAMCRQGGRYVSTFNREGT